MSFEKVTWNGCAGNLEIVGEKIIFCDNKQSVNDFNCKIEIQINKIDKQKLKKDLFEMKNPLPITLKNEKARFEFDFGFDNVYNQFINDIESKLLQE